MESLKDLQANMTAADRNEPAPTAGRQRESQADRSAAMRLRLVHAAVTCLCRDGYAATTIQRVLEEAGVSRGAMLHHFPTRIDLMIAVAEHASGKQDRQVRRGLAGTEPGVQRYLAITAATWEAMCQEPAMALIEIMVAARSDPALAARLPAIAARLEKAQREDVWAMAEELGIKDRHTVETMVRLHRAAMRGLAIERMASGEPGSGDDAMLLLDWYKRRLTGELLAGEPVLPSKAPE